MIQIKTNQIEASNIPKKRKIPKTLDKIQLQLALARRKRQIVSSVSKYPKKNILVLKKAAKIQYRVKDSTEEKPVKATTPKNDLRGTTATARSFWELVVCGTLVDEPDTEAISVPGSERAEEEINEVVKKPAKKEVKKTANNQVGLGEHSVHESSIQKSEGTPLFTVKEFSEKHHAFTESSLRNLINKAKSGGNGNGIIVNGMDVAIKRIGTRIYIHESEFFQWIEDRQKK